MKRLLAAALLIVAPLTAEADQVQRNGANGGSLIVDRTCTGGQGNGFNCSSDFTAIGPRGRVSTGTRIWSGNRNGGTGVTTWTDGQDRSYQRDYSRTRNADGSVTTISRAGPRGGTQGVTRTRTR